MAVGFNRVEAGEVDDWLYKNEGWFEYAEFPIARKVPRIYFEFDLDETILKKGRR